MGQIDRHVVSHFKQGIAWQTYSICSHSAERFLFKDMAGFAKTSGEKSTNLHCVWSRLNVKWNRIKPQLLIHCGNSNPQPGIHSHLDATRNSCLCMKVTFEIRALRSVREAHNPQGARGPWRRSERVYRQVCFSVGEMNFCGLGLCSAYFVLFKYKAEALDSPSALSENTIEICNRRTFFKNSIGY